MARIGVSLNVWMGTASGSFVSKVGGGVSTPSAY
jgi:hypothetical protein